MATTLVEKTATIDHTVPINEKNGDFLDQMRLQDNQIRDYCFTLNLSEERRGEEYSGLVSLCSTTI